MHRDGKVRAILKKTMKPQRSSAYLVRSLKRSEMLQCYSLLLPVAVLIIIFCYVPMYGLVIAFQNYFPGSPFIGNNVKWVALKHFMKFINGQYFWRLIKNTLWLSILNLIFGFTIPIIFALLLDQVRKPSYKKFVQTSSYLPYFISTVVVTGMVITFIDVDGVITRLMGVFGAPIQNWRVEPKAFPTVYTITNVWKSFGFSSILYFSTISSIDQGLYESARIDGANRWQQMWHITIPGISHIIAINLIMAIGGILNSNSEMILLLYTPAVYDVADVIGTYTYRLGIVGGQFSYTTAAGLFMSAIGFTLTFIANRVSNRLTGYGLW